MRFIVTGGAGFIGSNLAKGLLQEGHEVKVIDNLSTGSEENLAEIRRRISFIKGDTRELKMLRKEFLGYDYVLHEAGLASVTESIEKPVESHDINVNSTLCVLEAARQARVKRVVFASSASVYGDQSGKQSEGQEPKPMSPYALHKLAGELHLRQYYQLFGLETLSLRYFNVFGPGQDPASQYSGVISIFIKGLMDGRQATIFGDGCQTRDFCFVGEVVQANILVCKAAHTMGEAVNIGSGNQVSILQLYRLLERIMGKSISPRFAEPRKGEIIHSQADISKARDILGFVPTTGFEQALRSTVEWYLKKN